MLEVKNIYAGYNGTDVVKDVSLSVRDGESLCVMGPNGCGKTTLLKAIAGLVTKRGSVEIDGVPTDRMNRRQVALRVGILSQLSTVYFPYTVFETVMLGRYPHLKGGAFKAPSSRDRETVENCLIAVDMYKERDKDISRLSGGQLQRVFLARTLAQEPRILLLDEPTNHLDLKYQIELVDYVKKWSRSGGRSVIGVIHDLNLGLRLADKFLIMKAGRAEASGTAAEALKKELLNNVYGVDVVGYLRECLLKWERQ